MTSSKKQDAVDELSFETPVMVTYCLTGGIVFTTTAIERVKEDALGALILYKTDGTFTKIAPGWLSFDIQNS